MALFRNKNRGTHPATRGAPRIVCLLLLLFACAILTQGCATREEEDIVATARKAADDAAAAAAVGDAAAAFAAANAAEAAAATAAANRDRLAKDIEYSSKEKPGAEEEPDAKEVPGALVVFGFSFLYDDVRMAADEAAAYAAAARESYRTVDSDYLAYAAYTDEQVLALLFPDTPTNSSDLENPTTLAERLDIETLGNVLGGDTEAFPRPDTVATVTGNLAVAVDGSGMIKNGIYGFNVNLTSGNITNGAMSGGYDSANTPYRLAQGTGALTGNNFEIKNFQGEVGSNTDVSGSYLQGTAANGFKDVNDAVTGGSFDLKDSSGQSYLNNGPGTITDGSRTQ